MSNSWKHDTFWGSSQKYMQCTKKALCWEDSTNSEPPDCPSPAHIIWQVAKHSYCDSNYCVTHIPHLNPQLYLRTFCGQSCTPPWSKSSTRISLECSELIGAVTRLTVSCQRSWYRKLQLDKQCRSSPLRYLESILSSLICCLACLYRRVPLLLSYFLMSDTNKFSERAMMSTTSQGTRQGY